MWGVPVDHDIFKDINTTQWMWYFYNYLEDKEESFVHNRDMVEYHASFIEPEAVRKIRESRDEAVEVPHDEFVAGIEHIFGRKIGISKDKRKSTESHSINPDAAAKMSDSYKKILENQKNQPKLIDYRYWLDKDLTE